MQPATRHPGDQLEHWGLRLLRILAMGGLALCMIPMIGLVAFSFAGEWLTGTFSEVQKASGELTRFAPQERIAFGWNTLKFTAVTLVPLITPALFLIGAWWLRLRSWSWIFTGYLLTAGFGFYLLKDEDLNLSLTLEEFSPAFEGATQSHAVLMQYSTSRPTPEAESFFKSDLARGLRDMNQKDRVAWTRQLVLRRKVFETAWHKLEPQRRWVAEANSFDRFGDLSTGKPDDGLISFSVLRALAQCAAAKASIQALDGEGDAAIETLLPMLQFSQKLFPYSRRFIRFHYSVQLESYLLETVRFVLDWTTLSPETQARLAAVLHLPDHEARLAARFMRSDYAEYCSFAQGKRAGDLFDLPLLNYISPLVFHPNRTRNTYGRFMLDLQIMASRRHYHAMLPAENEFFASLRSTAIRNQSGDWRIRKWIYNGNNRYVDFMRWFWQLADQRVSLRDHLAKANRPFKPPGR